MTQIVGDATHIKSKVLSGELSSGETWVFDGVSLVPAGNEAYGAINVQGTLLVASDSSDTLALSGVSGIRLSASSDGGQKAVRAEVSGLVAEQIPQWHEISGAAWGGSGLASGASGIAAGASGIAVGASGIASGASGMVTAVSGTASGASGLAADASGIAVGTSGLATGASGIAVGASGLATTASGIAAGASGLAAGASDLAASASVLAADASGIAVAASSMAGYASGKLDDTNGTSGIVLASGDGLVVFSTAPSSGHVLKASGNSLLTDLYWALDQTGSGSVGSGNSYAFINVHGTLIDANAADDTLNLSGRSGILLTAVSGAEQGSDAIYVQVSGLASGQVPYWSEISGMAAAGSGAGAAVISPDYIPPSFSSKDQDEISLPAGRYYKAGFRWRGQYMDTANMQSYWDIGSRISAEIDATYASGTSPGMIDGAKVNNSWFSVFLVGASANDVLILPFVRIKAASYSEPQTIINPADHNAADNFENGFLANDDAWNGYRLVKWSVDAFDGQAHVISHCVNGSPDQIMVSGDITSELSPNDWLQLVPPPSMPCLVLGLIRIDGSGNLSECRTVVAEAGSTGDGVKGIVEGRIDRSGDTQLIWNPVRGQGIALWFNDVWRLVSPAHTIFLSNTALDLDQNALAYGFNYDVFAEADGTPLNFRLVAKKWTNDSTRSQELSRFQGVLVYDAATDAGRRRRFVGTVRLRNDGGTAKFVDSDAQRFVSNYYNEKSLTVSYSANANGATFNTTSWGLWTNWVSPGVSFVFCAPRTVSVLANGTAQTTSDSRRPEYMIHLDGSPVGFAAYNDWAANTWTKVDPAALYQSSTLSAGYHYFDFYRKLSSSSTSSSAHWAAYLTGLIHS